MQQFFFDCKDAIRGLRRDRGFATVVVLTLAIAIGATTAMFSIVHGSLLYEVAPRDPVVLSTVACAVAAFAIATSLFATRRGLAINPAAALREE